MPAQSSPYASPAMRAYANELTHWREQAGHNKAELSALLGYTPQFVGQVEACKSKPSKKFAEDCDTFFKTNGMFFRLWQNINDTRHMAILPPGFAEYIEHEAQATTMKVFSALLIHGLFQTADAVRAIMSGTNDAETAAELVDKRMARQAEILGREDPPQIFLVIDEGALHRIIGNKETHRAQLEHLLALGERPNIAIQVVPYSAGYYAGLTGSFTILGFEDKPDVAYTESSGEGKLLDRHDRVALQAVTWDLVQGYTHDVVESQALIRETLEKL